MTSNEPACYMYMYINSTLSLLESQLTQLEQEIAERKLDTGSYYWSTGRVTVGGLLAS